MGGIRDRRELFDQIIGENKRRLLAIAGSYAPKSGKDDLYQEIQLEIWKSLDSFAERSKLSTWVYRVAINTAIRFSQNAARHGQNTCAAPNGAGEYPPIKGGPMSEGQILEDFIQSLGETYRGIFLLFLEDLTYPEIANVTGIDEAVIRTKISRLRKKYIERYLGA